MNKKFDNNKLPSPEEMDQMIHMMERLRDESVGICMAMQERIGDRKNLH